MFHWLVAGHVNASPYPGRGLDLVEAMSSSCGFQQVSDGLKGSGVSLR